MLQFKGVTMEGIGPFDKRVAVDFAGIPGLLVALVGANGSGKTTFLEAMAAGALYRRTPTRGSLMELATKRGAYVETCVVNGAEYSIRQTVDPVSGKGESLVMDDHGDAVLVSAKVSEFDAWGMEHMPQASVLYSSLFAVQGSSGFLDLGEGDQKAVLLRVIGVEDLEKLAEAARENLKAEKQALAVALARTKDEKERGLDMTAANAQLGEAVLFREAADAALAKARAALGSFEARAAEVAAEIAEQKARREAVLGAEDALLKAAERCSSLQMRVDNNRLVLGSKDVIENAVAKDAELGAEETRIGALLGAAREACAKTQKDVERFAGVYRQQNLRAIAADERARSLEGRITDRVLCEAAVQDLPALHERLADAELAQSLEWEALNLARSEALDVAEKRVEILRPAMEEIAHEGDECDPGGMACDALAGDDQIVKAAEGAPAVIAKLEADYAKTTKVVEKLGRLVDEAEKTAARLPTILEASADRDKAKAEADVAAGDAVAAHASEVAATKAADAATVEVRALAKELDKVGKKRTELAQHVKRKEVLAVAEARIAELLPQLEDAREKRAAAEARLETLRPKDNPPLPEPIDLAAPKALCVRAEHDLQHAASMVAVAEARASAAKERAEKLLVLGKEEKAHQEAAADLALLAESLGRDGLQALEIDAAGPELTELINDVLFTCLGTRWSVSVETTRLAGDGKRQLEDLALRVLDTESGREGGAGSLSGGEKVLVGEAISLALTMLSCRRTGASSPTLIRDESGAALDPESAAVYVKMLRHAAAVTGASHVLFVSHSPAVQALADARLEFADGTVTVAA